MASPQPVPAAPGPSASGVPTWVKVLLALGLVIILGIAALLGAGYYFVRKLANEPGGARAAVIRMANPGYEVLEIDEAKKTMVVRHKKTGKQGEVPFDALRDSGVINPKDLGMSPEEAGLKAAPEWLQYPGSSVQTSTGTASMSKMMLSTSDSAERIHEYYSSKLQANGYNVSSVSLTKTTVGVSKDGSQSVTVQVVPGGVGGDSSQTSFLVIYQQK